MSRRIAAVPTRVLDAGEVIFREGDDPRGEAFLVHAGRVEVRRRIGSEDRLVRVVGRGDLLGELALFRDTLHSASAIAVEPVTLLVIPANRLHQMVRTNPGLAVALIRQLALRLREAEQSSERRVADDGRPGRR
jgi:CRP-like cAMP-binding protein